MEELRHRHCPGPADLYGNLYALDGKNPYSRELPEPDVHVLTTGGLRIPAHSSILGSVSPVLENIIDRPRKHRNSGKLIPMLGVPCEAVAAFIRFIYSSRCTEDEMEKYDIHLLALAHVYSVPQLKQRCIRGLIQRLTLDNVVDVLQLSRLCNAPDLHLRCMKLVYNNFQAVEKTEGWKFLQDHDPHLELGVLQFIDEAESRKKRTRRHREEQRLYAQLSEAMSCLEHIFTEGCTSMGPVDMEEPTKKREPCTRFTTCHRLQLLLRHLAACNKRAKGGGGGGCSKCNRMWQLLRLHSFVCDQPQAYPCKVPLCRQFKLKAQQEQQQREIRRNEDSMWKLLARKVVSAKAMSSLSQTQAKRKRSLEKSTFSSAIGSNDLHRIRSQRQSNLLRKGVGA